MGLSPEAEAKIAQVRSRAIILGNPYLKDLPDWVKGFRDHQVDAIERIMDAYTRAPMVVLDAPTGSGKTLIGESVRRLLRTRALYLCTTKSLQDQFAHDFPYARVLKGRSNYPTGLEPEKWTGDWQGLSCEDCTKKPRSDDCKYCTTWTKCPYEVAKRDAMESQLAVLNATYFLTEANGPGKFSDQDFVICDEADTLESVLMGWVSVEMNERRMRLLGLKPPKKVTVQSSWKEWLDEAIPAVKLAVSKLPKGTDDRRINREVRTLSALSAKLTSISNGLDSGIWVYTGRGENVSFKPSRVDGMGNQVLFKHSARWLLMSATVISASQMVEELGYKGDWEFVRVGSTFKKENRRVVVRRAGDMSKKKVEEEGSQERDNLLNAILTVLANHIDDRVLIHTVSYDLSNWLKFHLTPLTTKPVLTYDRAADRQLALDRFVRTESAILIAPSMDRGVDLPGEACRVQIIAKVPFPNLGDRQVSSRLHSPGGQQWYNVQTVRTIMQMTGRAVRSAEDWAITYILDSQFDRVWGGGRGLFPQWWIDGLDWRG